MYVVQFPVVSAVPLPAEIPPTYEVAWAINDSSDTFTHHTWNEQGEGVAEDLTSVSDLIIRVAVMFDTYRWTHEAALMREGDVLIVHRDLVGV